VQPVVFAEDQVSVVELPAAIVVDASVKQGAAGTPAGVMANAVSACTNPDPTKLEHEVIVELTVAVVATPLSRSAV
jgi:hypothetical protein